MEAALIPHLIRKDIRHIWILVLVWLLLLVAQAVALSVGFQTGPGAGQFLWQTAYAIMTFSLPLMQGLVNRHSGAAHPG